MAGACAGLKVLELGWGMAGSLAAMVLADNGADVVRAEIGGDDPYCSEAGRRLWSRGKRTVRLPQAGSPNPDLVALATSADVVVAAWPPSMAKDQGLDYEALAQANPRLVYAAVTGFGWRSPLSEHWICEDLVRARAGLFIDQRGFRQPPVFVYPRTASFSAAMLCIQGVLAALYARSQAGTGQLVDVSLMRSMLGHSGMTFLRSEQFQDDLGSLSFNLIDPRGSVPMYNMNLCADGRWIQLACQNRKFAEKGLQAVGLSHLWKDPKYRGLPRTFDSDADREHFIQLMRDTIARKSLDEWLRIFEENDAPAVPVWSTAEFMQHPQLEPNALKVTVNDPQAGPMVQPGLLMELSETPGAIVPAEESRDLRWRPGASAAAISPFPATQRRTDFSQGPLTGLRVLDLCTVWAGPSASRFLADLGAEVIKVESLQGDSLRNANDSFLFANRGKQSIAVDLKQAEGLRVLKQLVQSADMMSHNYRPGVAERLGMDYAAMKAVNPRIIYAHLTAYGNKGPYRGRPGFDPIFAAMSGLSLEQSGQGNPPTMMGITDLSVGLVIASAMLTGLHARERTGRGQNIEIVMIGVATYMLGDAFTAYAGKPEPLRVDQGQHGLGALYRLYPASSGWVFLACVTEEHWAALRGLLARKELADPRFATPSGRDQHWDALSAVLADAFSRKSADDWEAACLAAGVPCASARLAHDDQLLTDSTGGAEPFVGRFDHPVYGRMTQPGTPVTLSRTPAKVRPVEPLLGQHTNAVLGSLGYSPSAIAALRTRRVVG